VTLSHRLDLDQVVEDRVGCVGLVAVDEVDRALGLRRHADQHTVLGEGRVEGGEGALDGRLAGLLQVP
jgi:hypothetical protein